MSDHLPSIEQIGMAEVPLMLAHQTAHGIGYYVLSRDEPRSLDIFRRSMMDSLGQAAAALGMKLVPAGGRTRVVVDNDEPSTMRGEA